MAALPRTTLRTAPASNVAQHRVTRTFTWECILGSCNTSCMYRLLFLALLIHHRVYKLPSHHSRKCIRNFGEQSIIKRWRVIPIFLQGYTHRCIGLDASLT